LLADESVASASATVTPIDGVPTPMVGDEPVRTATFETYAPRQRYYE
jgi:hypothetical protein